MVMHLSMRPEVPDLLVAPRLAVATEAEVSEEIEEVTRDLPKVTTVKSTLITNPLTNSELMPFG